MKVLRVLGMVCLVLAAIIAVVLVMGSRLPRQHTATAAIAIAAPQARVWQLMEDVRAQPQWRPGLKAIEPLPSANGHPCWTEVQSGMRMPLCEDFTAAPAMRIVRIADATLPFGGTWTYELSSTGPTASNFLITENGTTGPAIWRFMGHYVFHEDTSIKAYEAALKKKAEQP